MKAVFTSMVELELLKQHCHHYQQQLSFSTQSLSTLYYALYDNPNRTIEITKMGWTIKSSNENIIFNINKEINNTLLTIRPIRYYQCLLEIVKYPKQSLLELTPDDIFDKFMKLTNIKNEDEQLLIKVYIISLFIPEIPHYMLIPRRTVMVSKVISIQADKIY